MRQNNKYIAIPNSYKLVRNMATVKKIEVVNRFQLLIFFFLLLVITVNGQIRYPVETQTIITPPYPGRLEDMGSVDVGNRLTVRLQTTDATIINHPVKFRVRITGRGITITTTSYYNPEPFLISFGETQIITGAELAPYFNVDNLGFLGLTEEQYRRTGRLPEGVYQVYVDVIDYERNNPISLASPGILMLFENEPPLLNLPVKNDLISALTPQNILFSWTSRQNPFSSPSFRPEYRFDLWEIWPDEKKAYEVVRGSEPIFTSEHLTNTSLIYTINEPLLLTGRQYAWRVQVIDPENNVPFKNNGYSEVFTFRFGKVCPVPSISVEKTGVSHIEVKWDGDNRQQRYQVQYREKRRENAEWYTKKTTFLNVNIDNLKSNTEYEFKVCGFCDDQPGDYSNTITAATKEETKFQCGAKPPVADMSNMKMLNKLNKFDVIRAGDFDVLVSEASGSGGTFTGKGSVLVPYLKFIRLEVDFNNIRVNDDYRLVDGEIKTVYNLNTGLVYRPNPNTTTNNGFIEIGTVHNPDSVVTGITITGTTVTIATANGGTVTVVPPAGGNGIVVVTPNNPNNDQYVADTQTGTVYSTNPNTNPGSTNNGTNPNTGNITPLPKNADTQYKVDFLPHKQEICGIDYPSDKHPTGNYETIQLNGKPYTVPWKSIESGQFDRLVAKINGGPADSVNYYRESANVVMIAPGTDAIVSSELQAFKNSKPLSPEISGNQQFRQLLLSSQGNKDLDKLFAWYPEYETTKDNTKKQNRVLAGQINLASYDKKLITVHLVPVNGSNCPDPAAIQKELNNIYKSAVVQWNVKKEDNITVTLKNGTSTTLDITDQNDQMDYTTEMDKVISVMKDQDNYIRKDYYLFFFNGFVIPAGKEAISGYMPYSRSFGFLKSADPVSIAHELGHGCFRLKHVFLPEIAFPQTKGTTDNLMDYATNNRTLLKYQWDEVHDWDLGLNWFDGEGEGEDLALRGSLSSKMLNKDLKTFTFITPASTRIALPIGVKELTFFHGIQDLVNSNIVTGTLLGFTIPEKGKYYAEFSKDGLLFLGYKKDGSSEYYQDNLTSKAPNETVIMLFPCSHGGHFIKFDCVALDYSENLPSAVKSEEDFAELKFDYSEARFESVPYTGQIVEGQFDITPEELKIIGDKCVSNNILYLHKIAQLRNMYPSYFENFTQNFNSWSHLSPSVTVGSCPYGIAATTIDPIHSEWDRKMRDNDQYRKSWKNNEASFYILFIDEFKKFAKEGNDNKEKILTNLSLNTSYRDAVHLILSMSDYEFQNLAFEHKIVLLKILTKGDPLTGNKLVDFPTDKIRLEAQAVKLFTLTENEYSKENILKALITEKDGNNEKMLLHALCKDISGFDNPEFTTFINTIYGWLSQLAPCPADFTFKKALSEKKVIPYKPGFWTGYAMSEEFEENNHIKFTSRIQFSASQFKLEAEPYEYVIFVAQTRFKLGDTWIEEGAKLKIPAIYGYMLFNNENTERLMKGGRIAFNVALMFVGVGEINAALNAGKAARMYLALSEMGVSVVDFTFNNVLDSKLKESKTGEEILDAWNKCALYYGIGVAGYTLFKGALNKLKFEADKAIYSGKLIDENGNIVKNLDDIDKKELNDAVTAWETKANVKADDLFPNIESLRNQIRSRFPNLSNVDEISNLFAQKGWGIDKLSSEFAEILTKAAQGNSPCISRILDRMSMDHFTANHFDEIISRLKKYSLLKEDLVNNPHWFDTFDEILENPGLYWQKVSQGQIVKGSELDHWANGYWWKDLREKSSRFQNNTVLARVESEYASYGTQISIKVSITDELGEIIDTRDIVVDFLVRDGDNFRIIDAKFTTLSSDNFVVTNALTDNQKVAFGWMTDPSKKVKLEIRAVDTKLQKLGIKQGNKLDNANINIDIYKSGQNNLDEIDVISIK